MSVVFDATKLSYEISKQFKFCFNHFNICISAIILSSYLLTSSKIFFYMKNILFAVAAAVLCTSSALQAGNRMPSILDVAYSKQNDGCHINTIEHFKAAINAGFNCLKADMQMTSDGVVVLCHDNGFTLDENGRIGKFDRNCNVKICEMKFADVQKLEYASGESERGGYPVVCTLEEYVSLCSGAGVWMYVTQRNNSQIDATMAELKRLLKKYHMMKRCIVNNFPANTATCSVIHKWLPKVPISYTMTSKSDLTREVIGNIAEELPIMICLHRKFIAGLDPELMKLAASKGIKVLGWYPASQEEYSAWLDAGLAGAQITDRRILGRKDPDSVK